MKRGVERIHGPDSAGGLEAQGWRNTPGGQQDDRREWVSVWCKNIRYPQSKMSAYQVYMKYVAAND